MRLKETAFFLLFIGFFYTSFGQNKGVYSTHKKKAISYFEQSEPFMIRGQFTQAVALLQKAIGTDNDFAEAHLRLGSIYKDLGNIDKAIYHLGKAIEILPNDKKIAGAYYSLGDINFREGNYDKAKEYLEQFKKVGQPQKRLLPEINKLLSNIEYAKEAVKHPLPMKATPLAPPINGFQLQYFPVLTADEEALIFTRREGSTAQYDEDIVISKKGKDGKWQKPVSLSPAINTSDNEGTTSISADGRMLIFTSCVGRKGYGSCDLFVTYKTGEEWSEPENLGPQINASSWESQPALSADGRTLYFISDRPTGLGKRDIWVSYFEEDGWSKAVNLGNKINTADDEVSPFIHANNQTLYFASKGHPGMGGFDLYSSTNTGEGWTTPENIGYPLNNSADQVSLFITSNGKKGFYSYEENYRTSYYSSKLYEFDVPEAIQVENKSNYVTGKVMDADTKKPLSAKIELYNIATNKLIGVVSSDSINGEYLMVITQGVQYALYVSRPNYLFKSLSFDYSKKQALEAVHIDVYLDPVRKGMKTTLNNVFFETDEYKLDAKSKTELDKVTRFLQTNPKIKIEIGGHTDDIGDNAYNKTLSINRAKAVYNYIIQNGVEKSQLQFHGYGEEKPISPNNTDLNRQMNRRIEFKIL